MLDVRLIERAGKQARPRAVWRPAMGVRLDRFGDPVRIRLIKASEIAPIMISRTEFSADHGRVRRRRVDRARTITGAAGGLGEVELPFPDCRRDHRFEVAAIPSAKIRKGDIIVVYREQRHRCRVSMAKKPRYA